MQCVLLYHWESGSCQRTILCTPFTCARSGRQGLFLNECACVCGMA